MKTLKIFCSVFLVTILYSANLLSAQVSELNTPEKLMLFIQNNPNSKELEFAKQKRALLLEIKKLKKTVHDYETLGYPDNSEEYEALVKQFNAERKNRSAESLLNELLNDDRGSQLALIKVENGTDCNMIFKISGKESFALPIPAHGTNMIIVPKGNYSLDGRMCKKIYSATQNINKNFTIRLH